MQNQFQRQWGIKSDLFQTSDHYRWEHFEPGRLDQQGVFHPLLQQQIENPRPNATGKHRIRAFSDMNKVLRVKEEPRNSTCMYLTM